MVSKIEAQETPFVPLNHGPEQSKPSATAMEFLLQSGFSFITPVRQLKPRTVERMAQFERFNINNPLEKKAKVIGISYYALELSHPDLLPLDDAIAILEKIDRDDDPLKADELIDKAVVAFTVDNLLDRAYDHWNELTFDQKVKVDRQTEEYTPENVAALKALGNMVGNNSSRPDQISGTAAKNSGNLLRLLIIEQIDTIDSKQTRPIS